MVGVLVAAATTAAASGAVVVGIVVSRQRRVLYGDGGNRPCFVDGVAIRERRRMDPVDHAWVRGARVIVIVDVVAIGVVFVSRRVVATIPECSGMVLLVVIAVKACTCRGG